MLDVVLRVPPLFAANSIFNGTFLSFLITDDHLMSLGMTFYALSHLAAIGLCILFVTLTTKQLIYAYSILLAGGVLIVSYSFNCTFVRNQLEFSQQMSEHKLTDTGISSQLHSNPNIFLSTFMSQFALAFSYNSLKDDLTRVFIRTNQQILVQSIQASSYLFFLMPVILTLLSVPEHLLKHLPSLSVLLAGLEFNLALLINFHHLIDFLHIAWLKTCALVQYYGMQGFAELQWERLRLPLALRIFWCSRVIYDVVYLSTVRITQKAEDKTSTTDFYLNFNEIYVIMQEVLILGTDSHVSLLGMTSVISFLVHYIGEFFIFIIGTSREEDRYMGTMSAILFFILALQTGLSGMAPFKRLGRLYCNVCLLVMAVLHFVHSMVHPELLTLSAGRNVPIKRHVRSLAVCLCLVTFPSIMITYLWNENPISTWLLAVIAFGVELVLKMLISLIIYSLFMIDAQMDHFWEGLDDYIYYVKSTGSTIEFLFGLFLFGNGAWILLFESGGTIRALMMCIHAYFNIWTQAKEGWKVFIRRRTAVIKICQLPIATPNELLIYSDVCAICYNELNNARVTRCHHMFHGVCLRKWLYIQDQCPLCHQIIYSTDALHLGQKSSL